MRLIGLAVALMLTLPAPKTLAAQESPWRHSLTPAGNMSLLPVNRAFSTDTKYCLLPHDDERTDCWSRGLPLAVADDTPRDDPSTDHPRSLAEERREPRRLLAALVISVDLAVSIAKATVPFEHVDFNVKNEGFFGPNTAHGGADKAAHFVDYVIISKEFAYIFEKLGYSENASRWLGVGTAITGGLLNEVGDGLTTNGFSPQDLLMDALGAGTAALLAATRVDDLVGFRSSIMGDHYGHDVYSMDLKLAGLARRLHLNVGPLRYLLFSVTYGVKDYVPGGSAAERQRQIGLEIGLNAEEILIAVGARRDTWWGWALHVLGDNIRFPFTAVGFRYDLNHGKWHGPNNGNFP
jgi:hypothetical protein